MNLHFSYDLQKDIENYQKASQSENNRKPTRMQALYIAEQGESFEEKKLEAFITTYIDKQKLDLIAATEQIKTAWQPYQQEFLKRIESMFGVVSPLEAIQVFLTTDTRCSYNIEQGYFFVSVSRPFQNKTIMHELLHFWTWWKFHEEVESKRITDQHYNDVKESLTELLNVAFSDMLGEAHDDGYPQHQKMREIVRQTWLETRDIKKVFATASSFTGLMERDSDG